MKDLKDLKVEFDHNLVVKNEIKVEEYDEPIPATIPDNPSDSRTVQKLKKVKKERNSQDETLILVLEPQERANYFDNNDTNTTNHRNTEKKTETNKIAKSIEIFCSTCQTKFKGRTDFEMHYRKIHQEDPIFSCVNCSYNVNKYQLFRAHFNRHQKPSNNLQQSQANTNKICRKCNEQFDSVESLREHNKTQHNNNGSAATNGGALNGGQMCSQCGKVLMTIGGLYTHRKMHEEKPKFRCDVCAKDFFQKINLINHHKTHGNTRPFTCNQCEKSFFEKSHLQRHLNFHTLVRSFECEICKKTYKTERCLKVHSAVHSSFRPFVCDVCQKGFLSSSKLKQHYNIHTGARPYKCKHCERDFTNYPNLLKHTIRRHKCDHRTGEKLESIPDYVTNKKKSKESKKGQSTKKEEVKQEKVEAKQIQENQPIELNSIKLEDYHLSNSTDLTPAQSSLLHLAEQPLDLNVKNRVTDGPSNSVGQTHEPDKEFHINDNSNDFDMYNMGTAEIDELFNSVQSDEKIDFTNIIGNSGVQIEDPPIHDISTIVTSLPLPTFYSFPENSNQFQLINPNLIHLVNNSRQMENSIDTFKQY